MRFTWLILALAACGKGDELGDGAGPTDETSDCAGGDAFLVGLEKVSTGGITVTLVDATPSPAYKGDNTWTLALSTAAGPTVGVPPVVRPWMPLHGHGLVPPDYTGVETDPGTYPIDTFRVTMPGQWEFEVDLGGGDSVLYTFCVEG